MAEAAPKPSLLTLAISVGAGAGIGTIVGQGLRPHLGWLGSIGLGMIAGAIAALVVALALSKILPKRE